MMRDVDCSACGRQIVGLQLNLDDAEVIGEHVDPDAEGFVPFVKLLDRPTSPADRAVVADFRHARCEPFPQQSFAVMPGQLDSYMPDTADDLLQLFEQTTPPSTLLVDKLRDLVSTTPIDPAGRYTEEQGWAFALQTYRQWAGLDLTMPGVLDAACMTLVHVRNAMYANGAWHPGDDVPSTVVFTMLRIFAGERLRHS